jgi:hypothetical protein
VAYTHVFLQSISAEAKVSSDYYVCKVPLGLDVWCRSELSRGRVLRNLWLRCLARTKTNNRIDYRTKQHLLETSPTDTLLQNNLRLYGRLLPIMDSESLRTASTYLNNLLLARGLLRNGADIDFVRPSRESRAQIINLVHDLVLRSDRDKDRNEHLSFSLRGLCAEDTRKDAEIERLRVKGEEHARDAVQARTAERVAKDEAKKIERNVKGLQEQVARLKTALAQVRTQCANDVKKRDLELARLKAHLQDQRRGNRAGVVAPSMTVSGNGKRQQEGSSKELRDPEYSLKQETTAFLTQLSQSLSDENDGLIGLLREALTTMKELLGLPANTQAMADSAIGSRGSADEITDGVHNIVHALPASYETLATELDNTLSHLRKILTNPNFVTVEEVEVRDDEIVRLRQGWEHMEKRWRDVLAMMDGWRRRMDTGETLRMEDLQQGMGLVSPVRDEQLVRGDDYEDHDQSFVDGDMSEIQLPNADVDMNESSILMDAPQLSDSLAVLSASKRKRNILEPPASFDLRPPGTVQRSLEKAKTAKSSLSKHDDERDAELEQHGFSEQPSEMRMTLHEKLDAVAREAAEAQTRKQDSLPALDGAADDDELQDDDTLGQIVSPVKKTKIRGRAKRRKSTLSREELAELLVVGDEE